MPRAATLLGLLCLLGCGDERGAGDTAPIARLRIDGPTTVAPAAEVVFDGSASSDGGLIVSYSFDFGDDSRVLVSFSPVSRHTYAEAGSYLVTLTVEDNVGNVGWVTIELRVSEVVSPT